MSFWFSLCAAACVSAGGVNRAPNPGFEVGAEGWSVDGGTASVVAVADTVEGRRVLEVVPPEGSFAVPGSFTRIQGDYVQTDGEYTAVSAYVRSVRGRNKFMLATTGEGPVSYNRRAFEHDLKYTPHWQEIGPAWQRITLVKKKVSARRSPYDAPILLVRGDGAVQIDAVQIEPGRTASAYAPSDAPQTGITLDENQTILHPGERRRITVDAYLPETFRGDPGRLVVVRGDHVNPSIREKRFRMEGRTFTSSFDWTAPDEPGLYTLRVRFENRPECGAYCAFAVVPRAPVCEPGRPDFFSAAQNNAGFDQMRRVGISSYRMLCEVPGKRDFAAGRWPSDARVAKMRACGITPILCVNYPPVSPKADLGPYLESLSAFVRRYRGKVDRYEIINEPYYITDAANYARLAKTISATIRKENPQAVIYGICGNTQIFGGKLAQFIPACLTNGTLSVVDGISVHPYSFGGQPEHWVSKGILPVLTHLRKTGREAMPLWDSESGPLTRRPFKTNGMPPVHGEGTPIPGIGSVDERLDPVVRARSALVKMALGFEMWSTFILRHRLHHSMILQDAHGSSSLSVVQLGVMTARLRGYGHASFHATAPRGDYVQRFVKRSGVGEIWCVWSFDYYGEGTEKVFRGVPPPCEVVDLYGRAVPFAVRDGGFSFAVDGSPKYVVFDGPRTVPSEAGRAFTPAARVELAEYLSSGKKYVDEISHWVKTGVVPAPFKVAARFPVDAFVPDRLSFTYESGRDGVCELWAGGRHIPAYSVTNAWNVTYSVNGSRPVVSAGLTGPERLSCNRRAADGVLMRWTYLGDFFARRGKNEIGIRPYGDAPAADRKQYWCDVLVHACE